ncbi:putative dna-repair protein rad13 protein [Phaeoacremonium minimum UCRPA7]|uniref:Putative dna-repair protein rad13 protein n=1 Tax=Phaeoacremonium minimum (strain UCR-PA7) TaxID=1286976 RepID=R8BGX4_PHAM7|nr:putative dna-repair protein rad13 protein [Phaeoacremonium minimum UCRPA7]EON98566.1 putative dna-repair protein rad13 protein [Phaeoacremonium minimum UCRPA7]
MGVNGLWQVLQPCARPTNLATLNRKRLAVDASIWIYQFLKAVRDKEGNALRNSHVVGFFRRLCKLLWFGILPVFVFDGGAPALKRATLQGRRRRREGRREDAVRTAGKLLAVQMQRIAEEEDDKRRQREAEPVVEEEAGEALPDMENVVYADEAFSSKQERQKNRKFFKQDQYHLPELQNGIEAMGKPEDPRIMSVEELEEYARQFHNGEDINLYDFSKIDFDGEFFKSLPPPDRYNILNAARIRSRLRMGLSKEQLDDMFPDRMAFSRFQIERVKERNHLTQRLMFEMNMAGTDLTMGGGGRIAGEKNREYILVKNDGVEGGWALGVVSTDKDRGSYQKPIDVDALQFQYQTKEEEQEPEDEDDDFEDVPIEGLNRLPKLKGNVRHELDNADDLVEDSMFIDGEPAQEDLFGSQPQEDQLLADEDEDLNRAIAMSLRTQHGVGGQTEEEEEEEFEDVPMPEWTQKAVDVPKPITSSSGRMVAHIVNNRANAAVPRRRESDASSDSDVDFRTALATARKQKKVQPQPKAPVRPNVKNPFDGPLPFEKLNWRTSIFEKKPAEKSKMTENSADAGGFEIPSDSEELEGGFEKEPVDDAPRPLPPWMINNDVDIRDSVKQQQEIEKEINEEDQELVSEERRQWQRKQRSEIVEIESSDDNDSDVEIVDAPPPKVTKLPEKTPSPSSVEVEAAVTEGSIEKNDSPTLLEEKEDEHSLELETAKSPVHDDAQDRSPSPEMEFEDVSVTDQPSITEEPVSLQPEDSAEVEFEDVTVPTPPIVQQERVEGIATAPDDDDLFGDVEYDEFSDPEEEELLVQMAEEAEEHARFASQLNNKPERQNQEDYERELRALRSQQKKDRRDADEVTQIMVTECQSLLRLFGIPYVTAPMEAEAQCAELVQLGLVDGIVTDDSDTFLFGGTRVYKNMFNSNKFVECYLSSDLEKELSLSRDQLIAIAQLLGSDYTEGLPGIGPVTAVEILSEFPGRDGLKEFRDWWQDVQVQNRPKEADASSSFRRKFRKSQAKKLFLPPGFPNPAVAEAYLNPETDKNPEQFQWGVPDLEGLRQFLMATIGWSQERTDEVLVPVIKDMNRRGVEGTQSNITRYFEGGVGVGTKESFAPRQRVKGSKRMAEAVSRLRAKAGAESSIDEDVSSEAVAPTKKRKARTNAFNNDEVDIPDEGEASENDDARGKGRRKARGKKAKA